MAQKDSTPRATRIEQYEAILDAGRAAMCAFDRDGKLIHCNGLEREVFEIEEESIRVGMSAEEYAGLTTWYSTHLQPLAIRDLPVSKALRGEDVIDERIVIGRGPDQYRYIVQSGRPLMVNGEVDGAAVFTYDVTSRREQLDETYTEQLEHAVRRSRMIADIVMEINDNTSALNLDLMTTFAIERIAREFHADSGMLWLLDESERLQLTATWNTDRSELADDGYPLEEFIFAHEALDRNRPLVVESRELQAPEAVVQCMGGAQSILVIPLRVRGERVGIAYLCIAEEYTLNQSDRLFATVWGRQCAQGIDVSRLFEQIEDANERLASVVDQMPQAVLLIDAQTRKVLMANSGAEDLFNRTFSNNVLAKDIRIKNNDGVLLTGSQHPFLRAINSGERITGEELMVRQNDGTFREVVANHAPIVDARGHIIGSVSVLQNRADFASIDRSRDEFISVVAHELRNPLTSLRGNLQLMERRMRKREGDEQAEDDLRRIGVAISEADRIGDLVTRVLDVSRVGMGRLDIMPAPLDAAALVRDVCAAAQAREPDRPVNCSVPESVPVEWDADRIYQVLSNLTQNADRYAHGTPLEVWLETPTADTVRVRVRDHGPGVPLKIKRRLFKQYYRFDDGGGDAVAIMADGSRGLGIGLYVSARLVKQHGGRMRVADAEGGGAEFIVELPRIAPKPDIMVTQ